MTTDTVARRDDAAAARVHWPDLRLSDLRDRPRAGLLAVVALATAITCVDVLVMYPAIARSMGHSPTLTWLTALGLGLLALVVAGMAGWLGRGALGNHPGSRSALLLPTLLVVGWAALGLLVMRLRLDVSDVATTVAYEGAASPSVAGGDFDAVAAGVFLAVHVLCGLLTFGDLFHWRNDAFTAGRAARADLAVAERRLADDEAGYAHLLANGRSRDEQRRRLRSDARTARDQNAAFAAELEQLVRVELATGLGDPSATGITSPRHPDNPVSRGEAAGVRPGERGRA